MPALFLTERPSIVDGAVEAGGADRGGIDCDQLNVRGSSLIDDSLDKEEEDNSYTSDRRGTVI